MLYITGDTHADFHRFSTDCFPEQKEMTKDDYVLICGDFGGIWHQDESHPGEKYWLKWLQGKPYTTLFCDGNHENFDRLYNYPVKEWHGGKVHEIKPNILHLMRGQVYDIEDKTFFVFGGASSHDIRDGILEVGDPRIKQWQKDYFKLFRVNHISWWKEELPSQEEMDEGMNNLAKHDFKVDYIITHSPPAFLLRLMDGGSGLYKSDILSNYLQDVKNKTEYKQWIFGHMHVNQNFWFDRCVCMYEQIARLL